MGRGECRRIESVERTHYAHRSGAVAFKAGICLLLSPLDNGELGPWRLGGRPMSHAGIGAPGLRSESCTSSRWAKGRVVVTETSNGNVHGRPQSSAAKAFLPFHDRQPGHGVVTGEVTVGMRGPLSPGRTRLATGKLQSECICTLGLTAHHRSSLIESHVRPIKQAGRCQWWLWATASTPRRLVIIPPNLSGSERSVIPCSGTTFLRSKVERVRNWHFAGCWQQRGDVCVDCVLSTLARTMESVEFLLPRCDVTTRGQSILEARVGGGRTACSSYARVGLAWKMPAGHTSTIAA